MTYLISTETSLTFTCPSNVVARSTIITITNFGAIHSPETKATSVRTDITLRGERKKAFTLILQIYENFIRAQGCFYFL